MRKAFTLIELLVGIAVISMLAAIVFRIGHIGSDSRRRAITVRRLQKVENALSGYYAAFGSYPPVKLHYSQNVYVKCREETGVQTKNRQEDRGSLVWANVRAACQAQPVGALFPYNGSIAKVNYMANVMRERANLTDDSYWAKVFAGTKAKFDPGFAAFHNPNQISATLWNEGAEWNEVQIFQFGLMSFLLPRYQFMTRVFVSQSGFKEESLDSCRQWEANNKLPANPDNGTRISSWAEIIRGLRNGEAWVRRIPSQMVCARWMPNFERECSCESSATFFGIDIWDNHRSYISENNPGLPIYGGPEYDSDRYLLDCITIQDGWDNEFFYHSPQPYQNYIFWSAGPNGKTFPPWIPLDDGNALEQKHRSTAADWMRDDIISARN